MKPLPCPPEHWDTFSRLLDAAFDLPPQSRASWVDGLAEEHAHLRASLHGVLTADSLARTADYLSQPRLPNGDEDETTFTPGQPIGPYRLINLLGRGGMGEVWSARRIDGSLDRTVALKLPSTDVITGSLRQRLQRERDILASLSHPHIAQLYDAGVATDGQPFLALELIEGQPIDRHCREHRLGIDARLALFQQVLGAVRFAHSRLVVHRDLKPSNILVTADGQVKLLDFGIAKLLDDPSGTHASALTRLAGAAMTPEYAAPEQLAGGDVSVATDVFALGVILFELLTGQRPWGRERSVDAPLASARIVADQHEAVGAAKTRVLRRELEGDLDAILACCLEIAPAARYASAEQLADDLDRHVRHLPIRARHITRRERAWKFVRRNRLPVAMASALAVALVAGFVGVFWQATRAERAAEQAREQARIAEDNAAELRVVADFQSALLQRMDVEKFGSEFLKASRAQIASGLERQGEVDPALLETFDRLQPYARPADVARRTLGAYLLEPANEEIERRFADRPRTRDTLRLGLVRSYYDLGLFSKVAAQAEAWYGAQPEAGDTESRTVKRLRSIQARSLISAGRSAEAVPIARELAGALEKAYGPLDPDTLNARGTLGMALAFVGTYESAQQGLAVLEKAAADLEKIKGVTSEEYLDTAWALGYTLSWVGRQHEAIAQFERVAAVQRGSGGRFARALPRTLITLCESRADLLQPEATRDCREAVDRSRQAFGDEHLLTLTAVMYLTQQLRESGQVEEGFRMLESSYRALQFADPMWINTHIIVGAYGAGLDDRGESARALPILKDAIAGFSRITGPTSFRVLEQRATVARCLHRMGRDAEASAEIASILEAASHETARDDPLYFYMLHMIAGVEAEQGRVAEAAAHWRDARAAALTIYGGDDPNIAIFDASLAYAAWLSAKDDATATAFRAATEQLSGVLGPGHPETLLANVRLADMHRLRSERAETCAVAQRAAAGSAKAFGDRASLTVKARTLLHACPR
ncbi:MAG TPA: serine/threonine-protein kinase [Nevskiaceae bacterium]|nr:serine/threonine-protein kinase [Nevskiaceae bacterium]